MGLRLVVLRDGGAGGVDRYLIQYRLTEDRPWRLLATYDADIPNPRAGLAFKASAAGKSADFSYVTVGEVLSPEAGDAIKLDFSQPGDGDSSVDWNQVLNTGGNLPVGTVVRHGDGAVLDGVSVVLSNYISGNVDNNPNSNNWPGTGADPYYILAADDIYYHGNGPNDFVTTFNVDPRLSYDVRIYALIGDNPNSIERCVAMGLVHCGLEYRRPELLGIVLPLGAIGIEFPPWECSDSASLTPALGFSIVCPDLLSDGGVYEEGIVRFLAGGIHAHVLRGFSDGLDEYMDR